MTKIKNKIAPYTKSANLTKGSKELKPKVATVAAIRPNTPNGAKSMIICVTLNIVSETACNTLIKGCLVSLANDPKPTPKITEKKMIGNMCPSVSAPKILEGIKDKMVLTRP